MNSDVFTLLILDEKIAADKVFKRDYHFQKNNYKMKVFYAPRSQLHKLIAGEQFDIALINGNVADEIPSSNMISGQAADIIRMLLQEIDSLEYARDGLEAVLNSISEGIEVSDIHGNIQNVNPAFFRITGIETGDRIGKNIFDVNGDGVLASVLKTQKPITGNLRQGPGAKREVIVIGSPVTKDGNMVGAIVLTRDISETINMAREIQNKREMIASLYSRFSKARYTFADISCNSQSMKEAVALASKAALSSSTVLISGESGTGKELFAQAIHSASRAELPFIGINCASIPENLLEDELFGHERGAFTDANSRKIGLLELAQKGTLFLDEIGDLNLNLQAKLLRVLQEREFRRVGGTNLIAFAARVIAATNRDLTKMVNEGLFRKDLFYRLNVMTIHVPPLRTRIDDLPVLADMLLHRISRRLGKKITGIEEKGLAMLMRYSWPGNVRELENILERAINICEAEVIGAGDIDLCIAKIKHYDDEDDFSLERLETKQIKNALAYFGNDLKGKKAAAKALGISLTGLYQKLKKYDIV